MEQFIYSGEELKREAKKKKKFLIFWFVALGVFLALTATFLGFFLTVDYDSPMLMWNQIFLTVTSVIFAGGTFFFFSLPFRRLRKYVQLLRHLETGMKETRTGEVLGYDEVVQVKNGVDFKALITNEWHETRGKFLERKVLLDVEMERPIFEIGTKLCYTTQGNVLISYEVLEVPKTDKEEKI